MNDLISVIIPVYKVEKYLNRCLNSITNQIYSNLEIILVDDGSPDKCPQICDGWAKKDKRVIVLHKENSGQAAARNMGVNIAKGEYICFVDSDDWVSYEYISKLYELINLYNADVAYCDLIRIKKEKKIINKTSHYKILNNEELMRLFFRIDGGKSLYSVCRGIYKKNIIANISFLEGSIAEDVLFTFDMYSKCKKAVFTDETLYFYFINDEGTTNSPLSIKDLTIINVWDKILKTVPEQYYAWAKLNRDRITFTLYTKGLLRGISNNFDKKLLLQWKQEIKKNFKELRDSNIFDWKRKLLLYYIVLFS